MSKAFFPIIAVLFSLAFGKCDKGYATGTVAEQIIKDSLAVVPEKKVNVVAVPASAPIVIPDYIKVRDIYTSQIGVREKTGNNDGAAVEKYLKATGLGKGNPWCAAFEKWCFDQAKVKTTITAWSPSAHNSKNLLMFRDKLTTEPRAGDVVCFYYANLGRIGHTGFYDQRINESVYESVEGNTNGSGSREGDGVYRKKRSYKSTYSISRWVKD